MSNFLFVFFFNVKIAFYVFIIFIIIYLVLLTEEGAFKDKFLNFGPSNHTKFLGLKKHEKIFAGVMTPEGDYIDYSNEDNRNPEEKPV